MMSRKLHISFIALLCTLVAVLLSYLALASLACFVTWSNDYWSLANWDGISRGLLFCVATFWVVTGVQTAITYDKEREEQE